jgi:hypothetical protein
MLKNCSTVNVNDELIRYLGAPAVRELLGKRGVNGTAAEAGFIWQRGAVADKPAFLSTTCPPSISSPGISRSAGCCCGAAGFRSRRTLMRTSAPTSSA